MASRAAALWTIPLLITIHDRVVSLAVVTGRSMQVSPINNLLASLLFC